MFNYERHKKSPAKHYHHLVDTFIYGTVLFIFGNYLKLYYIFNNYINRNIKK